LSGRIRILSVETSLESESCTNNICCLLSGRIRILSVETSLESVLRVGLVSYK